MAAQTAYVRRRPLAAASPKQAIEGAGGRAASAAPDARIAVDFGGSGAYKPGSLGRGFGLFVL